MDTITDDYMQSKILTNGGLLQQFPFLVAAKTAVDALGTCIQCQRHSKGVTARAALNQSRRMIGTMSDGDKLTFKKLLGVEHLRVQWTEPVGGVNKRQIADL